MAALPTYLPRLGIPVARLRSLISTGRMKAAEINVEIVVSNDSVQKRIPPKRQTKKELSEYKKHAQLGGIKIWVSEASRKYHIPHGNLSRWVKAGIIQTIAFDRNRRILNEQDVAYCS